MKFDLKLKLKELFGSLKKKEKEEKEEKKEPHVVKVYSPLTGKVVLLDNVADEAFKQRMLGDGVAVEPTEPVVVSPVEGSLVSAFPTGHAFTFKTCCNHGLLLHVGLNTVELKGEGFEVHMSSEGKVDLTSKLVTLDLDLLKSKEVSLVSPVVLLKDPTYATGKVELKVKEGDEVKAGDLLFEVTS